MRVLIVEPEKVPYEKEIETTLEAMQSIVGGAIQAVYPFEEPVALICNDEGKLLGLPLNRALRLPGERQPYDVIAGTFFLCGAPADYDTFASLTDAEVLRFRERFRVPELFVRIGKSLCCIPMET